MTDTSFQYTIEYLTDDGEPIGSVPFDPDWEPAREWAHWESVRRGASSATKTGTGTGRGTALRIVPVWDEVAGAPVMSAARFEASGGLAAAEKISTLAYFRSAAREGSADMIERGLLKVGAPYQYRVCAYAREPGAVRTPGSQTNGPDGRDGRDGLAFDVEETPQPLSFTESSLDAFVRASRVSAVQDGDEMPVFIPQPVMVEASSRARDAGKVETGGVLVGRTHRTPDGRESFLEVTAMIPAPPIGRQRRAYIAEAVSPMYLCRITYRIGSATPVTAT